MKFFAFALLFLLGTTAFSQDLASYEKKSKGNYPVVKIKEIDSFYLKVNLIHVTKPEPFSANPTPVVKKTVFNLSDRGQQALIETLAKLPGTTDKSLIDDLTKPLEKSTDDGSAIEVKSNDFVSRLDFKVDDQRVNKADRIDQLEIWVKLLNDDEVEFVGFNNFATKYKSIDFGTLSVNKVTGFTANAGINIGGTGATTTTTTGGGTNTTITGTDDNNNTSNQTTNGVSNVNGTTTSNASNLGIGFSSTKTVGQQIAIKSDMVVMKGSLSANQIDIFQDGAPNSDLDDDVNVNVICRAKNKTMQSYFTIKGLFNSETNAAVTDTTRITIKPGYLSCPKITKDVKGIVSFAFIYRKVLKGENTAKESDDVVKFMYNDDRTITADTTILFKASQFTSKLFDINIDGGNSELYIEYYGLKRALYFSDNMSALQVIEWLRQTHSTTIRKFKLFLSSDGKNFAAYQPSTALNLQFKEKAM